MERDEKQITARGEGVFTSLTRRGHEVEQTEVGISSLVDVWIIAIAPGNDPNLPKDREH
jgi:hypothetical protein